MAFWRKKVAVPARTEQVAPAPLTWRERTGAALGAAAEMLAGSAAIIGAPIAMVLGKFALALVLAAVALGIGLRLSRRRAARSSDEAPWPWWIAVGASALATEETAVLVEATRLSVRTDQPDFTPANWLMVLAAWGVAYVIQAGAIGSAWRRRQRRANLAPLAVARPPTEHGK